MKEPCLFSYAHMKELIVLNCGNCGMLYLFIFEILKLKITYLVLICVS